MVRGNLLAQRPLLRAMRERQHPRGQEPPPHALLVQGLPEILLRQNRHGSGKLKTSPSQLDLRGLYLRHQPQERVQHEALQGLEDHTEDGLVHAPPVAGGLGRQRD